ncbi:CotH kinase family protein [Pseudobacteroides cellulosolvens]|uniref:Spore coat protein CotH n=1 Tax=Pseudobacteroides cellulosolvens ATCC 35603 = DSM 2933 TaxID=398512 RepID=A0A0L6JKQ8_9FIRM|nr:CotH kinase family protein [Pseudobacteroides cellulosolvens]KNY25967.1 Spore coat protein CotH [Pseudobacteroides cellulosolvens ATCC 35603 = DSM 2933]
MKKFLKMLAASTCLVFSLVNINPIGINAADVTRPQGWTEESHGKKADPNYSLIFPEDKVNRIDIVISSENYNKMETNVKSLNMMSTEDPIYVPSTVKFNGLTWTNVGVRYKGSSTLYTPLQSQKHKLPLHLKFDKFEDQYPEIDNQRFYGFKDLKLSNCWYDPTFMRDKLTSDIFRSAGVPAACGAFYRVYIDSGSGPVYWGLYTGFEDPANKMLDTQFTNGDGNMYKGLSAPTSFGMGTTSNGADLTVFKKEGYEKKTNEDADDWTDLQALVTALNAPRSNAATWRANLEKVFNVNLFLKWLAINTAITNFDTYGWVTKNHYLYQDLGDNGRMVYVPWDFNLSLSDDPFTMMGMGGMGGGFGGFPGMPGNTIPATLSLSEIGNSWPLIRFLIDDPVYKNIYHYEMKNAMSTCFNQSTINSKISKLQELIRPYVVGTEGEKSPYSFLTNGATQFNQGVTDLKNLISRRHSAVSTYLAPITISPTPVVSTKPSSTPTPTPTPTSNGYKISGYVAPDFTNSPGGNLLSGFKVEVVGANLSATTNQAGYFEINNVPLPLNPSGYTIKISKPNYLYREIKNVIVNKNVVLGSSTSSSPIMMWAGDIKIGGVQDDVINMTDVIQIAQGFSAVMGDTKYKADNDLNNDNVVNMADIIVLVRHFSATPTSYPAL